VHALALRMLGDAGTAEETVQDVFEQLFRSGHALRHQSSLSTWLHTVALNRCRDTLRSRSFQRARDLEPLTAGLRDHSSDPANELEQRDRGTKLQCALDTLPAEMREVVVLRFASGMSYDEIASVLGCATGTVASKLHRALARLGAQLRSTGFAEEPL
jgi:RNA polymerase sigma-70 factor (ECF subfamily)